MFTFLLIYQATLLTWIITRFDEDLVRLCDADLRYGSDHFMIRLVLQQRKPPPLKVASKVRNFKKIDSASFKCDLEFELNNGGINQNLTVNDLVETLQNASTKVLNSHTPVTNRSRVVHPKPKPAWYNENQSSKAGAMQA